MDSDPGGSKNTIVPLRKGFIIMPEISSFGAFNQKV